MYVCVVSLCVFVCAMCVQVQPEEVRMRPIPCVAVTRSGKPPDIGAESSERGDTVLITESHFSNPSSN